MAPYGSFLRTLRTVILIQINNLVKFKKGSCLYISILFLLSIVLPCEEGEVELWGICYSIENTIVLSNINNASGEIPEKLCALANLEVLNLIVMFGNTNFLTGEIPDCICNLDKLTYLDFGWNSLSGEIP